MNQPPTSQESKSRAPKVTEEPTRRRGPDWQRPDGVAPGTWDYVHQRSIADHYDDFVADAAMKPVESAILSEALPPLEKPGSQTVLDFGCGTGRTAIPLAESGYRVIGIDLSQPMLDQMVRKSQSHGLDRVHAVRANLVQMDGFRDDIADHGVCLFSTLGMIQGRRHRQTSLAHAARMIRAGGTILLHVHHRWAAIREPGGAQSLAKSWLKSKRDSEHEFGDSTYAYRGLEQMFMHRFSRRELVSDLRQTGWQVAHLERLSIDGTQTTGRWPIAGGFFVLATNRQRTSSGP